MWCDRNYTEWELYGIREHFLDPYVSLWCAICAPFTVLLNLLVVTLIVRSGSLTASCHQAFVLLMALGDGIFGLSYLATRGVSLCFSRDLCGVTTLVTSVAQMSSVAALLWINCDKFVSLMWPLHYNHIVTPTTIAIQLGVTFICIFIGSLTNYLLNVTGYFGEKFGFWNVSVSDCILQREPISYTITFSIFYVIPNCVSLTISIYIFCLVHSLHWIGPTGVEVPLGKKTKRILFCFSATMWQTVTFLLYRLSFCLHSFYLFHNECDSDELAETICPWGDFLDDLTRILLFLVPLGSVGNPLITIATHRVYRRGISHIILSAVAILQRSHPSDRFVHRISPPRDQLKVDVKRQLNTTEENNTLLTHADAI